jgi:hypothetical protein
MLRVYAFPGMPTDSRVVADEECIDAAAAAPKPKRAKKRRGPTQPLPDGFACPQQDFMYAEGGPIFYPWKKAVLVANKVLNYLEGLRGGASPEELIDEAPTVDVRTLLENMHRAGHLAHLLPPNLPKHPPPMVAAIMMPPGVQDGPVVIAWPEGTPHWAEKTGTHARDTFTIPLRELPDGVEDEAEGGERELEFIRLLARAKDQPAKRAQIDAVLAKIQTEPVRYGKPGLQQQVSYLTGMTTRVDMKVGRDVLARADVLRTELDAIVAEAERALRAR